MKKIFSDAINLGLGITAASKEKMEALAAKIQKKCGTTKKESQQMVKDMVSRGEAIKKQFEKDFYEAQADIFEKLEKFATANKEALKEKAGKPAPKKAAAAKKAAPKKAAPKKPCAKKACAKKPAAKKAEPKKA